MSNLQRQIAHGEGDIGLSKVTSVAESIARLNRETVVQPLVERMDYRRLRRQLADVDLVVDASDSFSSRLDVNRACVDAGVPLVSGAAIRSEGHVAVFNPAAGSPCYRCLYRDEQSDENLSCSESGVLAPMVGVIGTLQALEAVKLLSGFGEPLLGVMLVVDGWSLQVQRVKLKRDPDCPVCGSQ